MQRAGGWTRTAGLITLALFTFILLLLGYCLANPNSLKPLAESITEWALNRPLEIDGDLSLSLSMTPTLSVTDARLGNAADGNAPYMIRAGYARAQIDLGALFDRRVHLLDLEARDAVLYLEDRVGGRPNWVFFAADDEDDEDGEDPWSFMIQQLLITDSSVYANIGELAPIELSIPHLEETAAEGDQLDLNGHGSLNGDPWQINGRIGPFSELLSAGQITLDLNLMIDDVEIGARGSIGNLAALSALDLGLSIYGPDAELLGEILLMPHLFKEDIALQAEIRPSGSGHALSVSGHVAEFDIETAGTIANLAGFDGWDGSALISGPDLGVFGKALQIGGFPDGPFEVKGAVHLHAGDLDLKGVTVRTEDATLTIDADFQQFPRREGAVGNIRLTGDDISEFSALLRLPQLPAAPFDVRLSLGAEGSEILNSTATVGEHELTVRGMVGEYPDFHDTDLTVSASGVDIASLLQAFAVEQPISGRYQAGARLIVDPAGLSLRQSTFSTTGAELEGDLNWPDPSRLNALTFRGSVTLADLAATGALFGISGLPSEPIGSSASLTLEDGEVTLDDSRTRLRSLEMIASGRLGQPGTVGDLELSIALTGPHLSELFEDALREDANPFKLETRVRGREDGLEVRSFALQADGGEFTATGLLALSPDLTGSHLSLNGSGSKLSAIVPAFPNYAPPDVPWQIHAQVELPDPDHLQISKGELRIGTVDVRLDGILNTEEQNRTRLTFSARGDRIRDIGQVGQVPWPDHPFDVTADLEGTLNSIEIENLQAHWGDSDLSGRGSVVLDDRPHIEVHGQSGVLDIYDLQHALFGAPADLEPEDDSVKVFSDAPIPMHLFADFDAVLDLQVDRFRGQRARLEDISLELNISDGVLQLNRAAYRDELGYFDASALLRPEGETVYLELALTGEDMDMGFFTNRAKERDAAPRYTMDVDIWGHGRTVAELAGSLNGALLVSSDGGRINNQLLEVFAGDFLSNVLDVLNPFAESEEFTNMDCLVLNAAVVDGKVKMEPGFVMRTDRLNMFVYGTANLKKESLDLSLASQARRGIGISAATITNPYFKVGGTLAKPALQLDPTSAAVAASVATATAGLSILVRGLFDRLMGTRNPCPEFLDYQQKMPARPDTAGQR